MYVLKNDKEDICLSVLYLCSKMGLKNKNDLDNCFHLKSENNTKNGKPRPVLVQFCCRWNPVKKFVYVDQGNVQQYKFG